MPRDRRVLLVLQRDARRLAVHGDELVALLDEELHDVVGDLVGHLLVRRQDVLDDGHRVVLLLARIHLRRDDAGGVEVAVLLVHLGHEVGRVDQLDLDAGARAEIGHCRGRQAADPEVGVDLAVLDGVGGLRDAEPLAAHVLVLVEARGLDATKCENLGGAAGRTGGDALALEVGHLLDALALDRHDMHAVRVEHHQLADRERLALELVFALERVIGRVDLRQRHLGLLRADELHVVDRTAGHARGRRVAEILGQHVPHAAAERVVDAAGAAGRDHDVGLLCERRRRRAAPCPQQATRPRQEILCDPSGNSSFGLLRPARCGRAGWMRCFIRTAAAMIKPIVAV